MSFDKPRERLLSVGEQALSTQELLAILLRTGTKQKNVSVLAMELLEYFGDLASLKDASILELQKISGIGHIKAIELRAAIELGIRIAQAEQLKLGDITSSQDAGRFLTLALQHHRQEHVVILYLNTKHQLLKVQTVFIGSANRSIAEPRDILREGLKIGATALIMGHNHPSGNPEPSQEDIQLTRRLIQAGDIVGIQILDHLIIGAKRYISLRARGYMS